MQEGLGTACVHGLNDILRTQPEVLEALVPFAGTVFACTLQGPEVTFWVRVTKSGVWRYETVPPEQATVHITGTPLALYRTLRDALKGSFLWSNRLTIAGDIGVLQAMSHILHNAPIDWEAWLSEYVGDFLTYGLVKHGKRFLQWKKTAVSHTTQSTVEYLQYETMQLPSAAEVADFCAEVDALSESVARLEARCQRRLEA